MLWFTVLSALCVYIFFISEKQNLKQRPYFLVFCHVVVAESWIYDKMLNTPAYQFVDTSQDLFKISTFDT